MSSEKALDFLNRHAMSPERIDPAVYSSVMAEDMRRGLADGVSSMDMIPTYVSSDGQIPDGMAAVVIDAGGTNFRSALVSFGNGGYEVSGLGKCRMPGVGTPCTWDEFIRFTADRIEPLLDRADSIGFCFSYDAEITPQMDGRVGRIDKEVVISGCEGKLIAAELNAELERRGITGKHTVIINDTVAVLLGGTAAMDKSRYSGLVGQVSGTGANTCTALPARDIKKLGSDSARSMIVNLESGKFNGLPSGDFDEILDRHSNNPGEKRLEKMTSGAYLGELARLTLCGAADEGLLSVSGVKAVSELSSLDTAVLDAWASGEGLEEYFSDDNDRDFVKTISFAIFERSARCMCVNLIALALLNGGGREKPMCVIAEGSLVQRGRHFRPALERLLTEYGKGIFGLDIELIIGSDTTLPGSAAAAILN